MELSGTAVKTQSLEEHRVTVVSGGVTVVPLVDVGGNA